MRGATFLVCALLVGQLLHGQVADTTLLRQANELVRDKRCKEADRLLAPLLKRDPPATGAIITQARCLIYYSAKTEEGLAVVNGALERQPEASDLLLFRADVYNDVRMFERAEADLRSSLEHAPDTAATIEALNAAAWNHLSMRKFEQALEESQRVLAMDSLNHHAMNNQGLAAIELGDSVLALSTMRNMVRLKPDEAVGWMNLGFLLAQMGQHEEALQNYTRAEELGYKSAALYNNRGYSRMCTGDQKGARQDVERSIRMNDQNSYAYRNLALIELREERKDAACTALERALSLGFTKTYGNEAIELRRTNCQ